MRKYARLLIRKITVTETCWEFTGYKCHQGYGRAWNGKKAALAHRLAYEVFVGPIPDGMTVDHICFNRGCVRPDHLRILSVSDNCQRQRRAFKTHCVNGHEFTPENTRYRKDRGDGRQRECRACMHLADVRRRPSRRKGAITEPTA